jgi:hypothetical protein
MTVPGEGESAEQHHCCCVNIRDFGAKGKFLGRRSGFGGEGFKPVCCGNCRSRDISRLGRSQMGAEVFENRICL